MLDKILRAGEGKTLRKLESIAKAVNSIEEDYTSLSDDELRGLTDEFKARYAEGESLDDLMPEAFATVREAAQRTLGQRHYDVQIMGGAALHLGNIAEMRTGEGKTLVATLPSYLNALSGDGVHVVTVNDYLAERDSEWMGRIHRFLGLEVGVIVSQMSPTQRRAGISSEFLAETLVADAQAAYGRREVELGEDVTRELERKVILTVLDRKWREHLYEMDYLRDGIGLRAMAQRDPLVEYQREGFDLFTAMMDGIKEETVGYAFNVEVEVKPQVAPEVAEQSEVLADASESEAGAAVAAAVSAGGTQSQEAHEGPTIEAAGLGPSRPDHMEYSAPDESGGIMHGEMDADEDGIVEVDPNASRAERRRAERSNRKNTSKKKRR